MGPLMCASLAGDVDLVQSLLEAKCAVDPHLEALPEMGLVGGLTLLHVVVMCLGAL